MYLRIPNCKSEDYSYLYDLFLKRGKAPLCRRFFPIIHSTWHLDGLVAAMQTDKKGTVQAGLLANRRWMSRDLPTLLKAYLELKKMDANAAADLLKTIKTGCNTAAFVRAYLKAGTQKEKQLIRSCFQGTTPSRFSTSTEDALASGDPTTLGQALCREIWGEGSETMVRLLIALGANINYHSNMHDGTPLILATYRNRTKLAAILLQQPAIDVNRRDTYRHTPLKNAIDNGNEAIVAKLLSHPNININTIIRGQSYLSLACLNNRTKIALRLLALPGINALVNHQDRDGMTALMYAGENENEQLVDALLKLPVTNVNLASHYISGRIRVNAGTGDTALMIAARKRNKKIVSMLLEHPQINVNQRNAHHHSAFICTTYGQKSQIAKVFLDKAQNLDIVRDGRQALSYLYWDNDLYSMIIERVNIDEAFIWALKERRLHDVKRFFPYVNVEFECPKTKDTPLITALRLNCIEAVELLMPLVDVNKQHSREKRHPIDYANKEGSQALLLSPHPLTFSYTKDNPFCHCIHGKEEELKSWLARNPKKVNALDKHANGDALLHYAAAKGHLGIVTFLLKQPGIVPNLKNAKGDSPLHIAIRNEQEDVVKLLISHQNTDINLKNQAGDTPLSLAVRLKKDSIAIALLKKGAVVDPLAIALSIESPMLFETLVKEPGRRRDLIRKK